LTTLPTEFNGFEHVTVLLAEVTAAVAAAPAAQLPAALVIDCTLGGGGHSQAILQALPNAAVIGLDRDPNALAAAAARLTRFSDRFSTRHASFAQLKALATAENWPPLAAVIADLGVSSHQFDTAERGFSFRFDGPLDMRMDGTQGQTLAEKLANVSLEDLADVLYEYGDIRHSIGTARIVLQSLQDGATTTATLAAKLAARLPRTRSMHPATQVFQALRIWVNQELDELDQLLIDAPALLAVGGVLGVISFHSGEDRLVKQAMQALAPKKYGEYTRVTRKSLIPQAEELQSNPRSRSARLRVLQKNPANSAAHHGEFAEQDNE